MSPTNDSIAMDDSVSLLAGLASGADEEIAALLAQADAYARDRAAQAEKQAAALIAEAEVVARAQVEAIGRELVSALALERKKSDLAVRDRLVAEIQNRVRQRLDRLASDPDYGRYVLGWIIEAAIGLGAEAATVNAGLAEWQLIDQRMLREAEAAVLSASGRAVSLIRSDHPFDGWQGVELVSADGRTSWDNRLSRRFSRAAPVIRRIAYEAAYGVADGVANGVANGSADGGQHNTKDKAGRP